MTMTDDHISHATNAYKWPVTKLFFNLVFYGQDDNLVNNGSITKNQCRIIKLKESWAS